MKTWEFLTRKNWRWKEKWQTGNLLQFLKLNLEGKVRQKIEKIGNRRVEIGKIEISSSQARSCYLIIQ